MSFIISRRDPALADVSDEALWQLTKLLYMDSADYAGDRAAEWLAKQELNVKDLDASLLRPKDLIARLAISMSKRKLPFCPEGAARLCAAHKALDPRVVRNMLLLVADECTIQTNRYRSLRLKEMLSPSLEGWMRRMDFLTALWLGERKFRRVFGCELWGRLPECAEARCEACMLAFVGGSALYLTDLRASVLARREYHAKRTGRMPRRPRLLRIVDSWISFYQADCKQVVCECSEALVDDIVEMRTLARERRDRESERRRKKGKPARPHCNSRVRLTEDGLPIPRQPRLRSGDGARYSRRAERRRRRAEKSSAAQGGMEVISEEEQQRMSDAYLRSLLEEEHDHRETSSESSFGQENNDTINTITESKTDEQRKKTEDWEDCFSDEDAYEKEDGEEEYWIRDYRNLVLRGEGGSSENLGMRSRLSFGVNTRLATGMANTSSWTSKVDDDDDGSDVESPREIEVPLLYRDDSSNSNILDDDEANTPTRFPPPRAVSSIYSCDERDGSGRLVAQGSTTRLNPFDRTISMISGFTRDSAVPPPLQLVNADKHMVDKGKSVNRMTALAMLEGREEVASCYETMGWGGPRK
ncbi:hypothetical protein TARUN_3089 [Trichoderma arundinaceum]|uniref:Uncharacterized protein n=1 Tax=Trichoderma arundinaceum TaxID=490622 RepID=A0A395NST0_TRIAR|nr:hypothetical protein TARUN_3089 [Trichoderma arundinaceum]